MTGTDADVIVVGAGVVGLAIARSLALRGRQALILEQHATFGTETSSRNSEVIHAGIYYTPGSLRARMCVTGKAMLYELCARAGVRHERCGKLLVATADDQLKKLAGIVETAAACGVSDLQKLTAEEAMRLEPEVRCVAAVLSPSTGVVDSHGFMLAILGEAQAHGAELVCNSPVARLVRTADGVLGVETADGTQVTARQVVVSAGLHATKLARTLPYASGYEPPQTYYAKGQYYALSGAAPFKRHVYPMPQGAWLGLHATVDVGGRVKFGPDIAWLPEIDYRFEPEKLGQFLDFIRSYYPGLDDARLSPDYTGMRPKLYREGEPVPDFALHGAETHGEHGLMLLLGIESPGLTASLALGEEVANRLAAAA